MVLTPIEGARYTSVLTIPTSASAAIRRNYATLYPTAHVIAAKSPGKNRGLKGTEADAKEAERTQMCEE
jgi:hypothetical protein